MKRVPIRLRLRSSKFLILLREVCLLLLWPSMEGVAFAEAADFIEEACDFGVPLREVWRAARAGGFWEEEVGDAEVGDGAGFAIGFGVEFFGEAKGGFACF